MLKRFIILLCLIFGITAYSQNVSNLTFRQDGNDVVIEYSLDKYSLVFIAFSDDGGKHWRLVKKDIEGEIGDNTFVWRPLYDGIKIGSDNVLFQVEAFPLSEHQFTKQSKKQKREDETNDFRYFGGDIETGLGIKDRFLSFSLGVFHKGKGFHNQYLGWGVGYYGDLKQDEKHQGKNGKELYYSRVKDEYYLLSYRYNLLFFMKWNKNLTPSRGKAAMFIEPKIGFYTNTIRSKGFYSSLMLGGKLSPYYKKVGASWGIGMSGFKRDRGFDAHPELRFSFEF